MTKRIAFLAAALMMMVASAVPSAQTAPVQAAVMNKSKILASIQGIWMLTSANGQDVAGSGKWIRRQQWQCNSRT